MLSLGVGHGGRGRGRGNKMKRTSPSDDLPELPICISRTVHGWQLAKFSRAVSGAWDL